MHLIVWGHDPPRAASTGSAVLAANIEPEGKGRMEFWTRLTQLLFRLID